MAASDLIITKGNRTPLLECEVLGIPSISVSFGYDPIDDFRIGRIPTNTALRARGLNCPLLSDHMVKALAKAREITGKPAGEILRGRMATVQRLQSHLEAAAIRATAL